MKKNTQLEEMVGAWTDLQHQFWDNCLQSKSSHKKSEWESACKRPLEITQEVMTEMLHTQAKFTHDAMRYASPELSESDIIDQYFESAQEMLDAGIKSEQDLLENWFSIVKEFEQQATPMMPMMQWNPMQQMNPMVEWSNAMNNVFHAWENAAEKTLDAQNDFVSHLGPLGSVEKTVPPAAKKPRAQTKKPSAGNVTKHQAAA